MDGLSHPYLSNHPTQSFASGIGDVVLEKSTPKKIFNKKIILSIASAIVFLVIFTIVIIVIFSHANNTAKIELSDTEIAFNRYANYLLFGQERDTLDGRFEPDQTYEVDNQLNLEPPDTNYWDKASSLLKDAAALLSQSNGDYKDELVIALNSYQANFNFIQAYEQIVDEPSEDSMLQAYLQSGVSGVDAYLDDFYGEINNLESALAKDFVTFKKQQYSLATGKFDFYSEIGCIRGGAIITQNCDQANITDSIKIVFSN